MWCQLRAASKCKQAREREQCVSKGPMRGASGPGRRSAPSALGRFGSAGTRRQRLIRPEASRRIQWACPSVAQPTGTIRTYSRMIVDACATMAVRCAAVLHHQLSKVFAGASDV
jgi:hypothetical protein